MRLLRWSHFLLSGGVEKELQNYPSKTGWLYQQQSNFAKVAKLTRRDRSTVACYVSEYEAAVRTAGYLRNAKLIAGG